MRRFAKVHECRVLADKAACIARMYSWTSDHTSSCHMHMIIPWHDCEGATSASGDTGNEHTELTSPVPLNTKLAVRSWKLVRARPLQELSSISLMPWTTGPHLLATYTVSTVQKATGRVASCSWDKLNICSCNYRQKHD